MYWPFCPSLILKKVRANFNVKTVFPGIVFHCKDETVVRPSYLFIGKLYIGKTVFFLIWDGPGSYEYATHDTGITIVLRLSVI